MQLPDYKGNANFLSRFKNFPALSKRFDRV